jgi:hypothetical protein
MAVASNAESELLRGQNKYPPNPMRAASENLSTKRTGVGRDQRESLS